MGDDNYSDVITDLIIPLVSSKTTFFGQNTWADGRIVMKNADAVNQEWAVPNDTVPAERNGHRYNRIN